MSARSPARGYTLPELVVAASLALGACLGGAQAVQLANRSERRHDSARVALAVAQRLDKRLARADASRCNVATAVDPQAAPGTCARLSAAAAADGEVAAGPVADKPSLRYRLQVLPEPTAPGLLRLRLEITEDRAEVLRHAILFAAQ